MRSSLRCQFVSHDFVVRVFSDGLQVECFKLLISCMTALLYLHFVNQGQAIRAVLDTDGSILDGSVIRVNIAKYPQGY
jgi:hypothetical protein